MKALWFTIRHLILMAVSLFIIYGVPIIFSVNYWAIIPFRGETLGIIKIVSAIALWWIIATVAKSKRADWLLQIRTLPKGG